MKITWYGKGCLLIEEESSKVLLDPYKDDMQDVCGEVDFVTTSINADYKHDLLLNWPGEYESKGIGIEGISVKNKSEEERIVFILSIGKTRLCHLGEIDRALDSSEVTSLGNIDILFLPVGGGSVIDAKVAHKLLEEIDPRMVIPIFFDNDENDGFMSIDDFKKEMGSKDEQEEMESVTINNLPEDRTAITILKKN